MNAPGVCHWYDFTVGNLLCSLFHLFKAILGSSDIASRLCEPRNFDSDAEKVEDTHLSPFSITTKSYSRFKFSSI